MDSLQDLENKVKGLESQVSPFTTPKKEDKGKMVMTYCLKYKLYIFLSLGILILLYFTKPYFVVIKDEKNEKKISTKKLFMWWIILSVVVSISIYFYRRKNE